MFHFMSIVVVYRAKVMTIGRLRWIWEDVKQLPDVSKQLELLSTTEPLKMTGDTNTPKTEAHHSDRQERGTNRQRGRETRRREAESPGGRRSRSRSGNRHTAEHVGHKQEWISLRYREQHK